MGKYLHLRQIGHNLFEWFDLVILFFDDGKHVLSQKNGRKKQIVTMSELDSELEKLWKQKQSKEQLGQN